MKITGNPSIFVSFYRMLFICINFQLTLCTVIFQGNIPRFIVKERAGQSIILREKYVRINNFVIAIFFCVINSSDILFFRIFSFLLSIFMKSFGKFILLTFLYHISHIYCYQRNMISELDIIVIV